jgi:hypothetical protein
MSPHRVVNGSNRVSNIRQVIGCHILASLTFLQGPLIIHDLKNRRIIKIFGEVRRFAGSSIGMWICGFDDRGSAGTRSATGCVERVLGVLVYKKTDEKLKIGDKKKKRVNFLKNIDGFHKVSYH